MPTAKLRRRRNAPPRAGPTPSASAPPPPASALPRPLVALLVKGAQLVAPVVGGIVAAASFRNNSIAIAVFVTSIIAMLGFLFLVFYSILKQKDPAPIPLPKIYNADGTTTEQPEMTVFDHDNKVATLLSAQLPAFALAAIWFSLWTGYMPALTLFSAFVLYRLFYHPLFRIHVWREANHPDLERPFGAAPIFSKAPDAAVKVIEGRQQFQHLLKSVDKRSLVILDCSASWCAPCRAMAPEFSKLAEQFTDCVFVNIDVDISLDLAADLRVSSIPAFYFYRNETLLQSEIGPSPQKLRQIIQSYL